MPRREDKPKTEKDKHVRKELNKFKGAVRKKRRNNITVTSKKTLKTETKLENKERFPNNTKQSWKEYIDILYMSSS